MVPAETQCWGSTHGRPVWRSVRLGKKGLCGLSVPPIPLQDQTLITPGWKAFSP